MKLLAIDIIKAKVVIKMPNQKIKTDFKEFLKNCDNDLCERRQKIIEDDKNKNLMLEENDFYKARDMFRLYLSEIRKPESACLAKIAIVTMIRLAKDNDHAFEAFLSAVELEKAIAKP